MNYQIKPCKFLKRGVLLFLLAILVWSCENDEVLEEVNQEEHTFKTVSKLQAQNVFNSFQKKREEIISKSSNAKESFLEIRPNWHSFKEESLNFTDALLSSTDIETNTKNSLRSRLIFLNVDDRIIRVIESKKAVKQVDNKLIDGFVYFHNLDGKFITGYKVENSIVTKRLVKKGEVSKASFFSIISFFTTECEEDLDPNSTFCDNTLGEVMITTSTENVTTEASVYYYSFGGGWSFSGDYDPYGEYSGSSGGGGLSGEFDNEEEEELEEFLNQEKWDSQDPYDDWNRLTECEKDFFRSNPHHLYTAKGNKSEAERVANERFGDCNNPNGHPLHNTIGDAYRHAYFAALNTHNMGYTNAKSLGDAHECDTPSDRLNEKQMDLHNNAWGYHFGSTFSTITESQFYSAFMDAYNSGQIQILQQCL